MTPKFLFFLGAVFITASSQNCVSRHEMSPTIVPASDVHIVEEALEVIFFEEDRLIFSQEEMSSFDKTSLLSVIQKFKQNKGDYIYLELSDNGRSWFAVYSFSSRMLIFRDSESTVDIRISLSQDRIMIFGPSSLKFLINRNVDPRSPIEVVSFEV